MNREQVLELYESHNVGIVSADEFYQWCVDNPIAFKTAYCGGDCLDGVELTFDSFSLKIFAEYKKGGKAITWAFLTFSPCHTKDGEIIRFVNQIIIKHQSRK